MVVYSLFYSLELYKGGISLWWFDSRRSQCFLGVALGFLPIFKIFSDAFLILHFFINYLLSIHYILSSSRFSCLWASLCKNNREEHGRDFFSITLIGAFKKFLSPFLEPLYILQITEGSQILDLIDSSQNNSFTVLLQHIKNLQTSQNVLFLNKKTREL